MKNESIIGRFATGQAKAVVFISLALCAAGLYAAFSLPSSKQNEQNPPALALAS